MRIFKPFHGKKKKKSTGKYERRPGLSTVILLFDVEGKTFQGKNDEDNNWGSQTLHLFREIQFLPRSFGVEPYLLRKYLSVEKLEFKPIEQNSSLPFLIAPLSRGKISLTRIDAYSHPVTMRKIRSFRNN